MAASSASEDRAAVVRLFDEAESCPDNATASPKRAGRLSLRFRCLTVSISRFSTLVSAEFSGYLGRDATITSSFTRAMPFSTTTASWISCLW